MGPKKPAKKTAHPPSSPSSQPPPPAKKAMLSAAQNVAKEQLCSEAITCSCCYSIIHKPLNQCCNGHVLPCAGCTKKMQEQECPQCRERFDVDRPIRALFLEQMAEG